MGYFTKRVSFVLAGILLGISLAFPAGAAGSGTAETLSSGMLSEEKASVSMLSASAGGYKTYTLSDLTEKWTIPDNTVKSGYTCTAMQAMNVGTTYIYTAKICTKNDAYATVYRTNANSKAGTTPTIMKYYSSINSTTAVPCDVLKHANDMVVVGQTENGKTVNYMYVATCNANPGIVRLRIEGDGLYLTDYINLKKASTGKNFAASSVKCLGRKDGYTYLLIKVGNDFYVGRVADYVKGDGTVKTTQIECYASFTIDTRNAVFAKGNGTYGTIDNLETWTNQGFGYSPDEKAVYVPLYHYVSKSGEANAANAKKESVILVYNLGSLVDINAVKAKIDAKNNTSQLFFPCKLTFHAKKNISMFEFESCGFRTGQTGTNADKKLYVNINAAGGDKVAYFSYTRGSQTLTPVASESNSVVYTVKYNANGGVQADPVKELNLSNNYKMYATRHVKGIASRLRPNTFKRDGYTFAGWYLYRDSDQKWLYNNNGSMQWFRPGEQPDGAFLALYEDMRKVSQLTGTKNDVVTCYAQWTPNATGTKSFYIQYNPNGGKTATAIPDTKVVYGKNTNITSVVPTRAGYVFSGWIAHRRSDNKFAYKKSSNYSDTWLAAGDSKTGCFPKAYVAGCVVSGTSSVDRDIVTFYAAWSRITGTKVPGTLTAGTKFAFGGKVESDAGLSQVTVTIKNAAGTVCGTYTAKPNATTFDLSAVNGTLNTATLAAGSYTYTVVAKTMNASSSTTTVTLLTHSFTVK